MRETKDVLAKFDGIEDAIANRLLPRLKRNRSLTPAFVCDWVSKRLGRRPRYVDKQATGMRYKWTSSTLAHEQVVECSVRLVDELAMIGEATGAKIVIVDHFIQHSGDRRRPFCGCGGVDGFTVRIDDGVRRLKPCNCSRKKHNEKALEWTCPRHGPRRAVTQHGFIMSERIG